ncbi:MAG: GNAT family N-acetyltransferase [Clostridiales bacterium]|nr:GNAT family N-acetyltransferase [Clostridiales bacterium]
MTYEKVILIDGAEYPVTISDDPETLLAAETAGRVIIGLQQKDDCQLRLPADYIIEVPHVSERGTGDENGEDAAGDHSREDWPDDTWLERVVRRKYGLPWEIARTERLVIREFTVADLPWVIRDPEDTGEDQIFQDAVSLKAYIQSQYMFFECGMWALIRQSDGQLIGMAGVVPEEFEEDLGEKTDKEQWKKECTEKEYAEKTETEKPVYELGYHIYTPYRRQGYAKEACLRLLKLVKEEYGGQAVAYVWPDNIASVSLLESIGFRVHQRCSGSGKLRYRHAANW